jgi:hypothetical protein
VEVTVTTFEGGSAEEVEVEVAVTTLGMDADMSGWKLEKRKSLSGSYYGHQRYSRKEKPHIPSPPFGIGYKPASLGS